MQGQGETEGNCSVYINMSLKITEAELKSHQHILLLHQEHREYTKLCRYTRRTDTLILLGRFQKCLLMITCKLDIMFGVYFSPTA